MKSYMYIAIRRDLSRPQQVVQACHAAIEACWPIHYDELEHPSVIALGVKSEAALLKFRDHLDSLGFVHYNEFREPDRNNELTSIATYPITEDFKHHFKKFQLLT